MNKKITSRLRRGRKSRSTIRRLGMHRLCVHKSLNHIYAQLLSEDGAKVLASASTLDKSLKGDLKIGGNIEAAKKVGALVAKRAQEAGVKTVAFDRSGFKYHGRIKALADAAREAGLEF